MKKRSRNYFQRVLLPVIPGVEAEAVLQFAKLLGAQVNLIGLLSVHDDPLSAVASKASEFRSQMLQSFSKIFSRPQLTVKVGQNLVQELFEFINENPHDLLLLEWPAHFEALRSLPYDLLESTRGNVAIVRGPWPKEIKQIFLPLRGGPNAEMAMRIGRQLPHIDLQVVNFSHFSATEAVEPAFKGLLRVLPGLPDVSYRSLPSINLAESILKESSHADLIVMGTSSRPLERQGSPSSILEEVLHNAPCATVAVKASEPISERWFVTEGELVGSKAISILVDQWFAQNTYRAREFDDLRSIVSLKEKQGLKISLALPALNEEKTVGNVITTIKTVLMDEFPLLDEIVLMDSMSTDQTREIAADLGIPVFIHQEVLSKYGARRGKGEALWKSLYVTHGDILAWIDTDIVNIHPRFVYGVIGPMLVNTSVQYVKGFYRRPLRVGDKVQAGGGGRVTELTVRPLLNLFYPELSGVIQPLSGEYGGRRHTLEQLEFFSGYGVEIGMLIEVFDKFGVSAISQVDLLKRVHHNQPLEALSKMSFVILQAFMSKLENRINTSLLEEVNRSMKLVRYDRRGYYLDVEEVPEFKRPPMISLPEYRASHLPA